jgi:hypothetical protein
MLTPEEAVGFDEDEASNMNVGEMLDQDSALMAAHLVTLLNEMNGKEESVTDVPDVSDVPCAVSGTSSSDIADDILSFVERFLDLPGLDEKFAFTAWVLHSHAVRYQECSPRLALLSPEPGSGKTRALDILELLVPNAYLTFDSSPAALFRLLGGDHASGLPTVLFDEVDNALSDRNGRNTQLIGILNSGYTRGKYVHRMHEVKGDYEQRRFEAFAPVALAGLHDLPPALASRSVIINMRPSLNGSAIERLMPNRERETANALVEQMSAWVEVHKSQLGMFVKDLPRELSDRSAQIWEPLIMIGDLLGNGWQERIREAAVNLSSRHTRSDASEGVRLLGDIRSIFETESKIFTSELLQRLYDLPDSLWIGEGTTLTARSLSDKLARYGIRSASIRNGSETAKGYKKSDFVDAWSRYLKDAVTSDTSVTSGTTGQKPRPCPNCGHMAWSA